jgi:hypothetical protein
MKEKRERLRTGKVCSRKIQKVRGASGGEERQKECIEIRDTSPSLITAIGPATPRNCGLKTTDTRTQGAASRRSPHAASGSGD